MGYDFEITANEVSYWQNRALQNEISLDAEYVIAAMANGAADLNGPEAVYDIIGGAEQFYDVHSDSARWSGFVSTDTITSALTSHGFDSDEIAACFADDEFSQFSTPGIMGFDSYLDIHDADGNFTWEVPTRSFGDGGSLGGGATGNWIDNRIDTAFSLVGGATNHVSPLVFDLDGDGIELTHAYDQNVYFDIDNDGHAERVGWVGPDDGLLAMDHNGNGNIDDITELYGDDIMPAFDKLALHDSNDDGVIDANDVDFGNFLIWRDLNQNGLTEDGELQTLNEADIVSVSLDEQPDSRWIEENYISSNSTFRWAGGQTGELVDAHFLNDNADSWFKGAEGEVFGSEIEIDFDALILPQSRGYGELAAFHIAMSKDPELKEMMRDLAKLTPWQIDTAYDKMEAFLLRWAGVEDNDPDARATAVGSNIDARHVDFLEAVTGITWLQRGLTTVVGVNASMGPKLAWGQIHSMLTARILAQGRA